MNGIAIRMKRRLYVDVLVTCQILSWLSNQEEWEVHNTWRVWKIGEVRTWFWWIILEAEDHVEGLGLTGSIILKWILNKFVGERRPS